jgi:hypothetical protein
MRTAVEWVQEIAEAFNFKNQDSEYLKNGEEFFYQLNKETSSLFEKELIDAFGGKSQGSEYWKVFKFKDLTTNEEVYIKWEGIYDSWSEDQWENDPFFVNPVQRLVTFYEK